MLAFKSAFAGFGSDAQRSLYTFKRRDSKQRFRYAGTEACYHCPRPGYLAIFILQQSLVCIEGHKAW